MDIANRETVIPMGQKELEKMRAAGRLAADLMKHLEPMVQPGVSTLEINDEAARWTKEHGAVSAPLNYHGFPKSICTSVNEVVCHGIPSAKQILKDGDIINVDVTPKLDGYHGDMSKTFFVGTPSPVARKLVEVTEECLKRGIRVVKPGARIGDIGQAIQEYAEAQGFSVVRDFVGHGIGRVFHTAPQIPHYRQKRGERIEVGWVFTIEPMINVGTFHTRVLADNWTAVTEDGKLSAQFEHTLVVTPTGVEILTLSEGETYL
jgi:methionyl aminopeptidase